MQNSSIKTTIIMTMVVSLLIGTMAGLFGGVFLAPLFNQTEAGKIIAEATNQVVDVEDDSGTISVVESSAPAVVSIVVEKELANRFNATGPFASPFEFFRPEPNETPNPEALDPGGSTQKQRVGGGTGFIISSEGLILTNKHVVSDEDAEYSVVMNDGNTYKATVLGRDFSNDLAVLKIEATDFSILSLGDSDGIKIGQTVIAIGYSLGEYENTVTKGVISGVNRRVVAGNGQQAAETIEAAIQTDAAINPGNSGGPLLNLSGEVIGINTAVNREGQSIGFAIPINAAKQVVDSINEHGRIVRPWLGVRYVNITDGAAKLNDLPVNYGALVASGRLEGQVAIVPGSPAEKAGLLENDIVLKVNDTSLRETSLAQELQNYQPGDEVVLKLLRDGGEIDVVVVLAEREQ